MPLVKSVRVDKLSLDLSNYRTVPQRNETAAIQAMIAISADWFWALMESILDSGYLPTENIIVLNQTQPAPRKIVKEGNRRVAILKLALGYVPLSKFTVPTHIHQKIVALTPEWKKANAKVPCSIYPAREAAIVDRIVTLAHGKGEKAGRDRWEAVARARHNRDRDSTAEPALDLLESYVKNGQNLTKSQKERWAGVYPLTVLEEAIKRLAPRVGAANSRELVKRYPSKTAHRDAIEQILYEIGLGSLGFDKIRHKTLHFADAYGIPDVASSGATAKGATATGATAGGAQASGAAAATGTASDAAAGTGAGVAASGATTASATGATTGTSGSVAGGRSAAGGASSGAASTSAGGAAAAGGGGSTAFSVRDPRAVMRTLGIFTPKGNNRQKVVALLDEARRLRLNKHPHAFCFVLRSMFELSAKAYCEDHKAAGLSVTKGNGEDKYLVNVLREITQHLTKNNTDNAKVKLLHGAMTELAKKDGLLSVTSLNQLIHNPNFSVSEGDISMMFFNIFPLLSEMN